MNQKMFGAEMTIKHQHPQKIAKVAFRPARLVEQRAEDHVHRRVAGVFLDLDDAAKYALRPGGQLEVAICFQADNVLMRFRDDGPGIPDGLHERIFDRFFRIDTDQSLGCGLGLAIVNDVAQGHGGSARCIATAGGSTFEITLPR